MIYCDYAALLAELGSRELIQLTDFDNVGSVNVALAEKALDKADAIINRYLVAYTLPLSVIPACFEQLAADIARYLLYKDAVPDAVRDRYTDAIKYLEQIGKGTLALAADTAGITEMTSSDTVAFTSSTPIFARDLW